MASIKIVGCNIFWIFHYSLTLPCMMSLMVRVTLGLASTGRPESMEAELAITMYETGDDLSCGGSCWLVAASQAAETHYKEVKVVTGGQGEAGDLAAGQVGDQEIRRYDRERGVRQEVRG